MQEFRSSGVAKVLLVDRIVAQAERDAVPLSDVEKKMLYFSESSWSLPDIMEVNAAFERECNQPDYERKIGAIVRSYLASAPKSDLKTWNNAVRALRQSDEYLLILIDPPDLPLSAPVNYVADRVKLVATALLAVIGLIAGIFLFEKMSP